LAALKQRLAGNKNRSRHALLKRRAFAAPALIEFTLFCSHNSAPMHTHDSRRACRMKMRLLGWFIFDSESIGHP